MNADRRYLARLAALGLLGWIAPSLRAQTGAPVRRPAELVGHWRMTEIIGGQPVDEHLVLGADGNVSNWTVTAVSRSAPAAGRWRVDGRQLIVQMQGQEEGSAPFTLHEGQLVLPNIPNRRKFWEKL